MIIDKNIFLLKNYCYYYKNIFQFLQYRDNYGGEKYKYFKKYKRLYKKIGENKIFLIF